MNVQNLLSNFSQNPNQQTDHVEAGQDKVTSPLAAIGSMLPGGLAGGAAAGGVMALLMGSKSARKMAKKVAKFGGTAVVGGLAYKAYDNWQANKALGQTQAITGQDIDRATTAVPAACRLDHQLQDERSLNMVLITTMIAASKADGQIDAQENQRLFDAIERLNFTVEDKAAVFDAMARDISVQELALAVGLDEHKAEVYLAAYLAIEVDNQQERNFLNNLAQALKLPKGFPAYLEQQADQGVEI